MLVQMQEKVIPRTAIAYMGTRRQEKEMEPQVGTDETNSRERTKGV